MVLRTHTSMVLFDHPYYKDASKESKDSVETAVVGFFDNMYANRVCRLVLGNSVDKGNDSLFWVTISCAQIPQLVKNG